MKKRSSDGKAFASAMQDVLTKLAVKKLEGEGKTVQQIKAKDLIAAQSDLESVVASQYASLLDDLYKELNAAEATAFFSYVIAKSIGYERGFVDRSRRNPVRERKQLKQISEIFKQGIDHMTDIIEVETRKAIKDGLIDPGKVLAAYKEQGGTTTAQQESEHQAKLVILPE